MGSPRMGGSINVPAMTRHRMVLAMAILAKRLANETIG